MQASAVRLNTQSQRIWGDIFGSRLSLGHHLAGWLGGELPLGLVGLVSDSEVLRRPATFIHRHEPQVPGCR